MRKFVLSLFLIILFFGCSRQKIYDSYSIDSINITDKVLVSADEGAVILSTVFTGKDYDKILANNIEVYLTYGIVASIVPAGTGKFNITVSGLNNVARSPVKVEVVCCGKKSYGQIFITNGKADSVELTLSDTNINSDIGEVSGRYKVYDKNRNLIFLNGVTIDTSYGNLKNVWMENGEGHFVLGNLSDVSNSPVTIKISAAGVETEKSINILVGTLNKFVIENIASPQITNVPFLLNISACDKNGNVVSSFEDKVQFATVDGNIDPGESGRFVKGQLSQEVMIRQYVVNEYIKVNYGNITGKSNDFTVNPAPASFIEIEKDSSLISADDGNIELTISVKNADGVGIAGKSVKVELYDSGNKEVDNSESTFGIVSSVIDNGDGTYTCFLSEVRDATKSPYNIRVISGALINESTLSVVPGEMDHFKSDEIPSQRAGSPFLVNITASDLWGNTVFVYSGNVTIDAECKVGNNYQKVAIIVNDPSNNPYFSGTNILFGQSAFLTVSFASDCDNARLDFTDRRYNGISNSFKVFSSGVVPVINVQGYVFAGFVFNVVFSKNDIPVDGECNFQSTPPNDIIAGEEFSFYVVARYLGTDPNNPQNIYCSQTGLYDIAEPMDGVVWVSDRTGTLKVLNTSFVNLSNQFPGTPGNDLLNPQLEKILKVNAVIEKNTGNNVININPSLRSGLGTGNSSGFGVGVGSIDHIVIEKIASPQIANSSFTLVATTVDSQGNTVPIDLNVAISDTTGSIQPIAGQFRAGRLSASVQISTVIDSDRIRIDGGDSKTIAQSNVFSVISPLGVDHFDIHILSDTSNIRIGEPVEYEAYAKNRAGNIVSSFNYSVMLTDLTNTVTPDKTVKFENGYLHDNFVIMGKTDNDKIYLTGGGVQGESSSFKTFAGVIDHFEIENIYSPQYVNNPFNIKITAIDIGGNIKDDYSGKVYFQDLSETITPNESSNNFVNGVLYQSVSILKKKNYDIIFTGDNNGHNGSSNYFNVDYGQLYSYTCEDISVNQHRSFPFHFHCLAYDEFGNLKEDYNREVTTDDISGTVKLSDNNSCVVKEQGSFVDGRADIVVIPTSSCGTTNKLFIEDKNESPVVSTVSNTFNIRSEDIFFEITNIGDQTKGTPFNIYITVKDSGGYLYTTFDGAVKIGDLTGTVSPEVSSNFNNGELTQEVKINAIASADKIILGNYSETVTKSNSFKVEGPPLKYFIAENVEKRQLVDYPFTVKFTAYDVNDEIKTDFEEIVTIDDLTGTLQPKNISFYHGIATASVKISAIRPNGDDKIVLTYSSFVTKTNEFSVEERKLDHFELSEIPDQRQYIVFYSNIYAKDLKGNTFENFHGSVTMEDYTNSIVPVTSDVFVNGILENQKFRIDNLANGNRITVYYDNGVGIIKGQSNIFNVVNSSVSQIVFDDIPDQTKNVPFNIHMRALDNNGDVVTGFEGAVQLSYFINFSNVINPTKSHNFISGDIVQPVIITESTPDTPIFGKIPVGIIANLPGVGVFTSNTFIVEP